jgi:Zn-dependent M28 family amino/carboxypeptidase
MPRVLPALVLAVAAAGCGSAATQPRQAGDPLDRTRLMQAVTELASPRYAGRRTGTEGGLAARAYVKAAFERIGLQPAGTNGFEQPFRFREYTNAANLLGTIRGTDPAARTIVISAHYDHLGVRDGATYHGADDNASGVAALLAIAQAVVAQPLQHPVLIAALDAEELGLEGAKALVAQGPVPVAGMAINVNLDMLARNDRNEIFAAGTYHSPWLKPILEDVQRRATVRIRFGHDLPGTGDQDWTLQSDHGVFHKAGVPFVYFGVEDHPDYHKPTDTVDKIDPAFLGQVAAMVHEAVRTLDRTLEAAR